MNFQTHKTDTGTIILSKKEYNILIADKNTIRRELQQYYTC